MPRRRRLLALASTLVASASIAACGGSAEPDPEFAEAPSGPVPSPERVADKRPNVIVIVTDDQEYETATRAYMPHTWRLLAGRGVRFDNFVISSPLCCPSRAIQLTGQYGHNNGVLANDPGYPKLNGKGNTLPVWLTEAGYKTAHVGKFLNGYRSFGTRPARVAPGWQVWFSLISDHYTKYNLSIGGTRVERAEKEGRYSTDELTGATVKLLEDFSDDSEPFYMQIDQIAPHSDAKARKPCANTAIPAPQDEGHFDDVRLPRGPSYDERDVSDKPSFIRNLPRISTEERIKIATRFRCRLGSLPSVDRGIAKIVETLERTRQANRTVILFYSDNGFFFGEHRLTKSKGLPYEESIRVPLFVYVPERLRKAKTPKVISAPTASIDLVATILDFADAEPCGPGGDCRTLDGRSMLPLLGVSRGDWPKSRQILLELSQRAGLAGGTVACDYRGVRTHDGQVIVEYTKVADPKTEECRKTSEIEHYDLRRDPHELDNLAAKRKLSTEQISLLADARRLQRCSGIAGRDERNGSQPFCE